jgi:crotonobetainyl-CoA:carnitine CoA-transferase CaiB-like acyl-CoA transferase
VTSSVLEKLWTDLGHEPEALETIALTGCEPVLPSSFAVGTAMQAIVAASALAAAKIWRARTGHRQNVGVDMRAAAIAARSERYLTIDGGPAPELWDKIAGTYECGDGRYVRLHTNFPHHRDSVLKLLGCANDKAAVAQA